MMILGFKESIIYNSKSLFVVSVTKNTQFRVMQVIIFVLFILWTAELCHEIHIFVRTTKLKCREIRNFA